MISIGEGNGTPLQYSRLENPMDGGAWWATVHGVAKSWTRLSNFRFFLSFFPFSLVTVGGVQTSHPANHHRYSQPSNPQPQVPPRALETALKGADEDAGGTASVPPAAQSPL